MYIYKFYEYVDFLWYVVLLVFTF